MITTTISSLLIVSQIALTQVNLSAFSATTKPPQPKVILGERTISLENRQVNRPLNQIYKDNILLNLAYMRGAVAKDSVVDWEMVRQPFSYEFNMRPGDTFAFHDLVLPQYQDKIAWTTRSHFGGEEGYKFDGAMYGMGVCHLASVINWAAKDAALEVNAPTNHDFYPINEIPKEHGVAIFTDPGAPAVSQMQNLYITNNKSTYLTFKFDFDGDNLKVSVLQ